jgi:predicted 3-demethylubiquinone-9 3-methyltransferase (glyoxalase superfamily)
MSKQTITPCLWFNNEAEEAAKLYTSLFQNSKVTSSNRYSPEGAKVSGQKEGSAMTVSFELEGQNILGLNGGPIFKHSPAFSFFVSRKTEREIDELWMKLSPGGKIRFGLDKYPWSKKYGWVADKYGIEWQFMLADDQPNKIAPAFLFVNDLFGKGTEAVEFYTSLFKDSQISFIAHDPANKTILHCAFTLGGQDFVLMEGQGEHKQDAFTPAFSLMINCDTQKEIDTYWEKLSAVPAAEQCGWLKDKFGVSWQVVPSMMGEIMNNPKKAGKAMAAMLKMKKLDIAKLKAAAES